MNDLQWASVKKILNINKDVSFFGGCASVTITMEQMDAINRLGLTDMSRQHNYSPTLSDFYQFAQEHQGNYSFAGYLYPPEKDEPALSVDAIGGEGLDVNAVIDFANQFHKADEFKVGLKIARAWYD